jgi:hypothetical protein
MNRYEQKSLSSKLSVEIIEITTVQEGSSYKVKRPEAGAFREGKFGGVGLVGSELRESSVMDDWFI